MICHRTILRVLKRQRRHLCEAIGIARYSHPAINDMEQKLWRHLGFDGGLFVEAGANDGFQQSNTYGLERFHGWTGLLVEPVPELASECSLNRTAVVRKVALGGPEQDGSQITMHFAGLMSVAEGALGGAEAVKTHVEKGLSVQRLGDGYRCEVPVRSLSSLLDECFPGRSVDLLSLDVEGYEVQALRGLDFLRHAPRFICVEARERALIEALFGTRYVVAEILSEAAQYQDILYRRIA